MAALIGTRAMVAAQARLAAGFSARVVRGGGDTAPHVELPACTVRFLVPGQLAYARSDAAAGASPEAIALAVWAFRAADDSAEPDVTEIVHVGNRVDVTASALVAATALTADIVLDGAVNVGTGVLPRIAAARRALDIENLRWPVLALDDLAEQLAAYRDRHARYHPERLAELLVEINARHRAVQHGRASAPSQVLGTEEAAETPLRLLRLTSLGARITSRPGEQIADVYLADDRTGTVLVLRHRWAVIEGEAPVRGEVLAGRRVGPATLGRLAVANLVTESAVRTASRQLRLASNRVARTTVAPSAGAWHALPDAVLIRDLGGLAGRLERLPPRMIRPRVDAESVYAIEIAAVRSIAYAPGSQQLTAVIEDPFGAVATVSATYRPETPAALDVLAEALGMSVGEPRFVSGTVHRTRGGLVVDPIALIVGGTIVVPDLAADTASASLPDATADATDPTETAIHQALSLLAEVSHRGARHLPPTFASRVDAAADTLTVRGLGRAGAAMAAFARALGPAPGWPTVEAWLDATVRLLVTVERR